MIEGIVCAALSPVALVGIIFSVALVVGSIKVIVPCCKRKCKKKCDKD